MADVLRSCAKTGCRWPAAASLSYRYATRQVWLLDLAAAPDPSLYDLCPHHADHLVVPKGWEQVDDRSVQEVMVEPSAFDRAEEAARRRMTAVEPPPRHVAVARPPQLVGAAAGRGGGGGGGAGAPGTGGGRNRYAALVEQLPQLAAEQQAHPLEDDEADLDVAPSPAAGGHPAAGHPASGAAESPAPAAAPAPAPAPPASEPTALRPEAPASPAPAPAGDTEVTPAPPPPPGPLADRGRTGPTTGAGRPLPARELAPSAADDMTPAPADPAPAGDPAPGEEPLPGQLSIPVDDLDETSGVVLQFDLAGARRRGKGGGVNP